MALLASPCTVSYSPPLHLRQKAQESVVSCVSFSANKSQDSNGSIGSGRRIWRRRKLTKKDDTLRYKMQRIPFLEEQVRKIRETGKLMTMDISKLMLSQENRFDFVNEVAEEAKSYVENNPDEYGEKKAIWHVLSNRMNEAGFPVRKLIWNQIHLSRAHHI